MRFYADLHIHSKYSRATSRNCDLEHLAWWARRKGITVVATGDFTHPAWFETLREKLVPAEPGLFRLREDIEKEIDQRLPRACRGPVRFLLEVEISTIYKKGEKTRKVHHLLYAPDFETAGNIRTALGKIGNLNSDGRPILGLDSRDLLDITLESGPGAYLVPAHIWTPWFAAMGSKSGFDSIEECYGDLAGHIFAVETGLSSDPPMNWRISGLDRFTLVSNSDAHSPPMLGREACVFDTDLDYFAIRRALETRQGYGGTVEFFPEEGKYHMDGHRACNVCLDPEETRRHKGRCPACGKPVTVGVMHRVESLADRPEGEKPDGASPFKSLVPLPEIVSEIERVGPKSKTVERRLSGLVNRLGPELHILESLPAEDVGKAAGPLMREALERLRRGDVRRQAGYDGEYGVIRLFENGELERRLLTAPLFNFEAPKTVEKPPQTVEKPKPAPKPKSTHPAAIAETFTPEPVTSESVTSESATPESATGSPTQPSSSAILDGLDPDQRRAATVVDGPLLIVAGPGTGKTRTLTHRLAHRVAVDPADDREYLALTFTRRAAEEMRERLDTLLPTPNSHVVVTTFHGLGLRLLREQHREVHLDANFRVVGDEERRAIAEGIGIPPRETKRWLETLGRHRRLLCLGESVDGDPSAADFDPNAHLAYEAALRGLQRVDFDDLLILPLRLFKARPDLRDHYRQRFRDISIDEYQDIDALQYRLVRQLVGEHTGLCAIGDPDQSIYRFRGAEVGFFLRFREDFPGARTVQLSRNYRSSPVIVGAALEAVAPSTLVDDRRLRALARPEHDPIVIHGAASEAAEAEFVAHGIETLLGGTSYFSVDSGRVSSGESQGSLSFDDIAVLYRTDAQAAAVIEALERAGIPHQKRSHRRLAERPGVRRILTALERDTSAEVAAEPLVDRLERAYDRAIAEADDELHGALVDARNLLTPLAVRHGHDLPTFVAATRTGDEIDTWDPRADKVSLLTLHAAKGLEFPVVFLIGCADGTLPFHFGGGGDAADGDTVDDEAIAEERRLFFVGLTRARDRLFLSWPKHRRLHGKRIETQPSPFLADLDRALVEKWEESTPRKPRVRRPKQLSLL